LPTPSSSRSNGVSLLHFLIRFQPTDSAEEPEFRNDGPAGVAGENGGSHPGPGKRRTLFYSYYANRVRGDRALEEPGEAKVEAEPAKKRRCSASWARLIAKVFHADPLTCRKCGGKLKIVAYLHDTVAIKQILDSWASARRRPCTRSCACPSMRRAGRSGCPNSARSSAPVHPQVLRPAAHGRLMRPGHHARAEAWVLIASL